MYVMRARQVLCGEESGGHESRVGRSRAGLCARQTGAGSCWAATLSCSVGAVWLSGRGLGQGTRRGCALLWQYLPLIAIYS